MANTIYDQNNPGAYQPPNFKEIPRGTEQSPQEGTEPTLFDQAKDHGIVPLLETAKVVEMPGMVLDPEVRERIAGQRIEFEDAETRKKDEELGKFFLRHRVAIAGLGVGIVAYVCALAGTNPTAGVGLTKRAHQLEHLVGVNR